MLNRRILRSKAVQNLYAFIQCREADYELAKEHIESIFQPDLNSMEVQDRTGLKQKTKQAIKQFDARFDGKSIPQSDDDQVENAVKAAHRYYEDLVKKDFVFFKKQMLIETERIYDWYLLTLSALQGLAELEQIEEPTAKSSLFAYKETEKRRLSGNQVVKLFTENITLNQLLLKRGLDWSKEGPTMRKWMKEVVRKSDTYLEWTSKEGTTLADDIAIATYICKELILKHEVCVDYFQEQDSRWEENKATIKSLVNKTFKDLAENNGVLKLMELSPNWEEDKAFFSQIFASVVEHDAQYEEIIAVRATNWDKDRIAAIDKAIMKLAIDEMINFPGIPVKVTINEYIDISKNFSTPKSKQFINGLLDKAAADLTAQGVIKKSGRGLIDNK